MKKQIVLTLALSLAVSASFAEGTGSNVRHGTQSGSDAKGSQVATAGANAGANAGSQAGGGTSALDFNPVSGDVINRYAASSAIAPALTTSNDTCMGSSSLGAGGASFSVSIGSTWEDQNCKMLKNAREMWNQGNRSAAMALMCSNDDNRYAISVSGGVVVSDGKGGYVRIGCPMTKEDWVAAGKPLVDPATGQPITAGSQVSMIRVPQQPVMAKQDPALIGPPVPQAVVDTKASAIEDRARLIASSKQ